MTLAVCTTTETREDAQKIARACVAARLAACVHIEEIASIYVWQGDVQEGREFRLTMKTTAEAYPALETLIQQHHSYDLPAIYAFEVVTGSAGYLDWVRGEVDPKT
ncbi:divalent-cation tolerance protein CutA [Pannonibacter tanglangensis]|uniref:Divalent cation tolerance protein CutA n=1 Tax=Pannonibacter tanglangensis TaxID=2750084 RepID=A0ABW9ZFE6_9HYPH|nr:divalent-cation tolerance protein CutA [Pannonibacter sp. XCT-34]NBN63567.1 divalent cation tolerance protein CutA [Pannonibacter sp. XCT-34]